MGKKKEKEKKKDESVAPRPHRITILLAVLLMLVTIWVGTLKSEVKDLHAEIADLKVGKLELDYETVLTSPSSGCIYLHNKGEPGVKLCVNASTSDFGCLEISPLDSPGMAICAGENLTSLKG